MEVSERKFFKAGRKVKKNETTHTEMTEDVQYDLQNPKAKRWRKSQRIKKSRYSFVKVARIARGTYSEEVSK
jgi:hypothetical protein